MVASLSLAALGRPVLRGTHDLVSLAALGRPVLRGTHSVLELRGGVSVLSGLSGSGRMTMAALFLAKETQAQRPAAWVDGGSHLYPPALAQQGIRLERLLIVRAKDAVKAALALVQIVESGAFGLVVASGLDRALNAVRCRQIQLANERSRVCTLLLVDPDTAMPSAWRQRTTKL